MKYFSIDPKESKTTDEYISLLEKEYADLKKQLKIIKDDKQHEYYAKLSDGMYKWTYIRILMDDSENTGKNSKNILSIINLSQVSTPMIRLIFRPTSL